MASTEKTTLYRLYDSADALLYVGISGKWLRRIGQHAAGKGWWEEVVTVRRETFPSRTEALAAEARAIREEHPRYNVRGTKTRPRRERRPSIYDKPTTLYRAYADTGQLLYVGTTNHLEAVLRHPHHFWTQHTARVETEEMETLRTATTRKAELVAEHQPPYNRVGGGYNRWRPA